MTEQERPMSELQFKVGDRVKVVQGPRPMASTLLGEQGPVAETNKLHLEEADYGVLLDGNAYGFYEDELEAVSDD